MSRVLVIEDEAASATAIRIHLARNGHDVRVVTEPNRVRDVAETFLPEVALCDWLLGPGFDGLEISRALRELAPGVRVVLMTGMPGEELERRLSTSPVDGVLYKPVSLRQLDAALEKALGAR